MRGTRLILSALTVSVALAAPSVASAATPGVLATAASRAALPGDPSFVTELAPGLRVYALPTPAGTTADAYADQLGKRSGVFATQVDHQMHAAGLAQACADVPDANQSQALVNAVGAAAIVAPETTKPIAILDTGVDPNTSELRGRVLQGFNAATGSSDTSDIDGHGTEVAAVAAAKAGRFQGISPTSPILPIAIYNRSSETTAAWVVRGIQEAAARGAAVINLSSSNPSADVDPKDAAVLDQAITAAFAKGTITVVSAGNEGKNDPAIPGSLTRVLTVGSASADGTRDAFSNFGPWIDVVSPGASMILPAPGDVCTTGYGVASGTSFSAPAVAGAAALIWSQRPGLNAQQLFDVLRMGAVKDLYQGGRDDDSGFGLLDVATGISSGAPIKQPGEVDDDVFWLKQSPKTHPTYLKKAHNATIKSAVEVGKDPQDVFPVYVKRGQTLTANGEAKGGDLGMGIWRPSTGDFDIGKARTTYEADDSEGVTPSPRTVLKVTKTGTYYVSVEAPDLPDPKDDLTAGDKVDPQTTYTLKLHTSTTHKAKKKAKKKKKK
jgi:subtilisin family serine protease